jgi:uncharacterized delta-60 repeat protein
VVALPDGKLLTAGYANSNFVAARYNADGTFDTTFGNGGLATIDFKGGVDQAMAVALQPPTQPGGSAQILLAGSAGSNGTQFGVVRLNLNGTLDTTFGDKGSKGKVIASPVARVANQVYSMAVLPDGRFLLAGLARNLPSTAFGSITLARFNRDGTLDNSFGNKGTLVTTITADGARAPHEHVVNVAIDGNGRIVVAASYPVVIDNRGNTKDDFLVARFNANGSPDTSFGAASTGVVTTAIQPGSFDRVYGMTLQSDGKILLAGYMSPDTGVPTPVPATLVRYNPNGSLDTTFDQDGIAMAVWDTKPGEIPEAVGRAVAVQPDGKILLGGEGVTVTAKEDGSYEVVHGLVLAFRFNADGSRDTSYGPDGTGVVVTKLGYGAFTSAMELQADGRVVLVGNINTAGPSAQDPSPYVETFALTRFTGTSTSSSAVQIGSFTASPATVQAGSPVTLTAGGITTANAGATIQKVAFYYVDSSGTEQFLGYGTANAGGTWSLTFAADLAQGSYTLLALAIDSTRAFSDPLSLSLQVL